MSNSTTALHANAVIDAQVMAFALAFATRDVEDQEQLIEDVMRSIAKRADDAISKTAVDLLLTDALRNSIFAECMERLGKIKRSTLAIAKDLRD
ncbi:hypothetical protein [Comamonas thiooxydans]|uniref:hypothetical protein n=1 Tax=Comamonas thiooxydans TaxID=363952 RepID=UPI00211435A7|nr:hypothetical protein [Comamonas thiooxydans]UUE92484.1 hypothetical protein MJ608_16205 [Comamonas thiooxydans]